MCVDNGELVGKLDGEVGVESQGVNVEEGYRGLGTVIRELLNV